MVLPLPVDPRTTTTELFSMRETSCRGKKKQTKNTHTESLSCTPVKNEGQQHWGACGADTVYCTSCLFLVMGNFGYSLLERGAGAGPKVEQQLTSNCDSSEEKRQEEEEEEKPRGVI